MESEPLSLFVSLSTLKGHSNETIDVDGSLPIYPIQSLSPNPYYSASTFRARHVTM